MKNIILVCIILLSSIIFISGQEQKGEIIVNIDNFRNDKGEVFVFIFDSEEGFPDNFGKASKQATAKIENKKSQITFKHINYGTYAVSVFHDENLNGKLEENWIGIPKEGISASVKDIGSFGAPDFNDSKFELKSEIINLKIKMKYF